MANEKNLYGSSADLDVCSNVGVGKSNYSFGRLLAAGFMAGAYIAFGFILSIVASAAFSKWGSAPNFSLFKILIGIFFPVGLIAVLIGGADLWTGNVQMLCVAKLEKHIKIKDVLYNWFTSFSGNFLGSIFMAFLVTFGTGVMLKAGLLHNVVVGVAKYKVGISTWHAIWLGIACNWLVNLAIWLYIRGKDTAGKVLLIWFPIFAFVTMGFEHSIANMWAIPTGIFATHGTEVTWMMFFHNVIPVAIGNALGGFFFVSLYHWYISKADGISVVLKEIGHFFIMLFWFALFMLFLPYLLAYLVSFATSVAFWLTPVVIIIYFIVASYVMSKIKNKK